MMSFGELALFMEASAARAKGELTSETGHLIEGAVQTAKDLIGQELDIWPPLAESTVREKERLGYVGQISSTDPLLRTGDLRDSLTGSAEATVDGVEGEFGSDSKIALYQEIGTSRIPPRPFIATASVQSEPKIEEALGELAVTMLFPSAALYIARGR